MHFIRIAVQRRAFLGALLFSALLIASACSDNQTETGPTITLPSGAKIIAELAIQPEDQQRGLMFRQSLARDRGMLFVHQSGQHPYWMYQCNFPIDIIWMDENRRVVEISPNTPPCKSEAKDCPSYGGRETSMYVLEVAAGVASEQGVRVGSTLSF